MEWYKTLDIHTKINAKVYFELLTGIKFEDLSILFSLRERMDIMYDKLKIEGFEIK
jgi:hypothetical protein